jgi:hypothetical protein
VELFTPLGSERLPHHQIVFIKDFQALPILPLFLSMCSYFIYLFLVLRSFFFFSFCFCGIGERAAILNLGRILEL